MILSPIRGTIRIVQHFKQNPSVYSRFGLKGHNGIDLTGQAPGVLVPIYSPVDGTVTVVGNQGDGGYGKYIRIRTAPIGGRSKEVVLGHFSKVSVTGGQKVNLGDSVGIMGNTGFSTGPHLHFGLRYILPDNSIENYKNGFFGYADFEPYLLTWVEDPKSLILYPFG